MAEVNVSSSVLYALLGGALPAIVWLLFWLREDDRSPEPRILIFRTFILGMLAVPAVLPFQLAIEKYWPGITFSTFVLWAIVEEAFKLLAAYWGGLKSREDNEPLDPLIYMITAALGFAALENALFIATPLLQGEVVAGVITGNLRFIGSSLLHTVSSGIIGVALAFAFYKPHLRLGLGMFAFFGAVVFHAGFNVFVSRESNTDATIAFGAVWASVAVLLLIFERVKRIVRK